MRAYKLDHLSDPDLLHALTALVARERATTAELLAHIAEVDARRLYAPAGYPSMVAYCVGELRLSDDSAFRRIRAARTARQFPAIFIELAEGRLNLTAVILLTPYLTHGNAAGLLKAAVHRSRSEIEDLLARRFPRTELLPMVEAVASPTPGPLDQLAPAPVEDGPCRPATSYAAQPAPAPVETPRTRVTPSGATRFALHVTIGADTHEKLHHAQALLSHKVPAGDLATVLDLALDALVEKLEKRKFAKTDNPRSRRRRSGASRRHIPAHVKRAVWQRDGGQCTFVGENGHRCGARRFLEFDHVQPVARGGEATVAGVRLRCRAHNQYEAERVFGAGFMSGKRAAARHAAKRRRDPRGGRAATDQGAPGAGRPAPAPRLAANPREATAPAAPAAPPATVARATLRAEADDHIGDLMAALRGLGVRGDEARRAIECSGDARDGSLEERVRAALKCLWPRGSTRRPVATSPAAAA